MNEKEKQYLLAKISYLKERQKSFAKLAELYKDEPEHKKWVLRNELFLAKLNLMDDILYDLDITLWEKSLHEEERK